MRVSIAPWPRPRASKDSGLRLRGTGCYVLKRKPWTHGMMCTERNRPHAAEFPSRLVDSCAPALRQFRPRLREILRHLLPAISRAARKASVHPHGASLLRATAELDLREPA